MMTDNENVKSTTFIGVEIGGTKLQAGLGDGCGGLVRLERVRAHAELGHLEICRQTLELIRALLASAESSLERIACVGIGFGGPVDARAGMTLRSHQVAGWDRFPINEWMTSSLGLPAVLGNDSDLAGLAEAHFGAGRGYSPVVYMNVGSGIGGALVIHGRNYPAQGIGALEIGHLRFPSRSHDQPGPTLESLCSGWGMADQARAAADRDRNSLLWALADHEPDKITAEVLVEAVRRGDPTANRVWAEAIARLALAIANVITLLHPARFVLGGGVAMAGDLLFDALRWQVARNVFEPFADSYLIVPAALGESVVVHGALKLAHDATAQQRA
jgi:glucokinase